MYDSTPADGGAFGLIFFAVMVGIYLFFAYMQWRIANKVGCADNAWWAFVPIMNTLLLCDMAGKERWWFFLALVPLVNIIVFAVLWFDTAKAAGFDGWLGLMVLLPFLNVIALAVMAFGGGSGTPPDSFPRSGQIDPSKYTRVG
jgi:hypothetical protein